MSHDPEAAWPLTQPADQGYYPGTPTQPIPPSNLIPAANTTPSPYVPPSQQPGRPMPWGVRIAILAIIMAAAIPITIVVGLNSGIFGLIITWVGIVLVAGIALGPRSK